MAKKSEETVGDILNTLTLKQRQCVQLLIGQAMVEAEAEGFRKGLRAKSSEAMKRSDMKNVKLNEI